MVCKMPVDFRSIRLSTRRSMWLAVVPLALAACGGSGGGATAVAPTAVAEPAALQASQSGDLLAYVQNWA
jgi:hypothetical protein